MAECNKRCGVCFMFAPVNHPAMKKVAPVRKALGRSGVNNYIIGHDDRMIAYYVSTHE
jgi:anthranilate phosphoribosyltransferase